MRKARILFALVAIVAAASSVGCGDGYGGRYSSRGDNEIVFGITQKLDPATGKMKTSAGYEMLELAGHGGWTTQLMVEDEGRCWFERLEQRLGQPRVEFGSATFRGGKLASPVTIAANQSDDTALDGPGWSTNDTLTFNSFGFAAPTIGSKRMDAPAAELDVTSPAASTAPAPAAPATAAEGQDPAPAPELVVKGSEDLKVSWKRTPGERVGSRVMVALDTDEPGGKRGQVRCFYPPDSLDGTVPQEQIARLFASAARGEGGELRGTLTIATHRQLTIYAAGGWTFYVVASTIHREQSFVAKD